VATEAAMTIPYETQRPIVSDDILAVVVYLLYGVGYFTGISALIGVIIAYVKVDDADPVLRSHYRFQIRTFWIGLLYLAIGIPLCLVLIGLPILTWWFIWSLVRIVKGALLVTEHKPIANPRSWLFGLCSRRRAVRSLANIPPRCNRNEPICFSPNLCRAHNLIERFFD
jgi:uncharacterized membrane protein